MRHFATESGKNKGQFYTLAEVSRIIAKIIGIHGAQTSANTKAYDPTCGRTKVSLPPTAEEQTAIATLLSDMDAELAALETKLAKARHLKQGMAQDLLTGRIRLV